MKDITKRFLWLSVYAVAMALLEAVVVAYIRELLQITDDHVTLGPYIKMEMWREAATLVMLVAVGWLAGRRGLDRLSYGIFAFGLWDILFPCNQEFSAIQDLVFLHRCVGLHF